MSPPLIYIIKHEIEVPRGCFVKKVSKDTKSIMFLWFLSPLANLVLNNPNGYLYNGYFDWTLHSRQNNNYNKNAII